MNPVRRRESVCRSLFGPVDHDQLRRDLQLKLKEITEQDSRRWNFNFESETPLPGLFQWEEIPADRATAFYQEPSQVTEAHTESNDDRLSAESAGADQENRSSVSNKRECPAEVTPVRRKRRLSKPAYTFRSSARITDFFTKRRRTTETKSILNPFHITLNEAALCKTIR